MTSKTIRQLTIKKKKKLFAKRFTSCCPGAAGVCDPVVAVAADTVVVRVVGRGGTEAELG